ncbi:hypothetical protein [Clostridium baratii]|uniref:hypothetical protein n=1 Tax=Clostridium baratii TaxID=1561 RepID=UPI0030CC8483
MVSAFMIKIVVINFIIGIYIMSFALLRAAKNGDEHIEIMYERNSNYGEKKKIRGNN